MANLEIQHHLINKRKLDLPQIVVVGAHTDDDAMWNLTKEANKRGYGITLATMTNSNNRQLPGVRSDVLSDVRWGEAKKSGEKAGVTQVFRLPDVEDGLLHLERYTDIGIEFLSEVVLSNDTIAMVTPHEEDPHSDHQQAAIFGRAVAGNITPLYRTDTISGLGEGQRLLVPDLYVPLSPRTVHQENLIYLANTSQVTDLPPEQMRDVQDVLDMTARRGKEIKVPHAAVLFDSRNTGESPLRDIFRPRGRKR